MLGSCFKGNEESSSSWIEMGFPLVRTLTTECARFRESRTSGVLSLFEDRQASVKMVIAFARALRLKSEPKPISVFH